MTKITVTSVSRSSRCISATWSCQGKNHVSNFYRHSDGTWGMDHELSLQSSTVQSLLWILVNDRKIPKKAVRTAEIHYDL